MNTQKKPGYTNSGDVNGEVETLSTIAKLAKSKKLNFTYFKKLDLTKAKILDFVKANFSKTDFVHPKVKKAFIHLKKTFIKVPVLYNF